MIDRLVLRCWFRDPDGFDLRTLGVPLEGSLDAEGTVYALRHPWESIASSFSGLAFKVFHLPENRLNPNPYIEIKASPAKLAQGHNLFGSDDLGECALVLIEAFCAKYPHVLGELDLSSWEVAEADITYFSRASNRREAEAFIAALQHVSRGHTKARGGHGRGTCYFGKVNSRLKRVKVYDKLAEVCEFMREQERAGDPFGVLPFFTPELLAFAEGMIRWEVTLKKRWWERRGISNKLVDMRHKWSPVEWWTEATADIFEALEGEKMNLSRDAEIAEALKARFSSVSAKGKVSYRAALAAFNSFRAIKHDGFEQWSKSTSRTTRFRHLTMLHEVGIPLAALQNQRGENVFGVVVPLVRYVSVDFGAQFPEWYRKAA